MEIYKTTKKEVYSLQMPVPNDIANKAMKSICKISIKTKSETMYASGFFMNINDTKKYLITNHHIISKEIINNNLVIEIHNHKKMILSINNREIKYFERPKITIIEIKNNDDIYNDIEFLDYDSDSFQKGHRIYQNANIFSIEHPLGDNEACRSGKITNINNYEFEHNISIDDGSYGCPIILLNNNLNLIKVIGIHKEGNLSKNINYGNFIFEIFNNDIYTDNNNYIIAETYIKDEDVQRNIRIINSYEEYCRTNNYEMKKEHMNEEEIKKCEIKINDNVIPFNYFYKFPQKGKYTIKYTFNNYLTNTNHMFCDCNFLTNLDLFDFNTQNVTNMSWMFSFCKSLKNINLSNYNTQNTTNISWMFSFCESLTNINLSSFNTQNVSNMSGMFFHCESLTSINLSNFNTQNVKNMSWIFFHCDSLTNINLSSFNTQNVKYMNCMFSFCESLTNINLSTFNTQNVKYMCGMFSGCKSLTNIDLSNFNTQNVKDMSRMFSFCETLTKINLSNFNTQNSTDISFMFSFCESLRRENIISKNFRIFQNL